MSRGDLSEGEWRTLQAALLIARTCRPPDDLRQTISGILWRIRTGTPWRDVPEKYGRWMTVYLRFRRWSQTGVWEAVAHEPAEQKVEPHPLHQLPLRAKAVKRLQQQRPKQSVRRDRWPAKPRRIQLRKLLRQIRQPGSAATDDPAAPANPDRHS